jgi:hypothetical protein
MYTSLDLFQAVYENEEILVPQILSAQLPGDDFRSKCLQWLTDAFAGPFCTSYALVPIDTRNPEHFSAPKLGSLSAC